MGEENYKKKIVIAGYLGQVGSALFNLAKEKNLNVEGIDIKEANPSVSTSTDYLHIAFPYVSSQFLKAVVSYASDFSPLMIFIHSSVLPNTSRKLFLKLRKKIPIVYTPIRGQHDALDTDIRRYKKFFAVHSTSKSSIREAEQHLKDFGFRVKFLKSPEELELIKLLDVVAYGVSIAFAQEIEWILKTKHFNYENFRKFQSEHVNFYPEKRSDIYPGIIGGNCVIQDTELMRRFHKSEFFDLIIKNNERKKLQEKLNWKNDEN